MKLTIRLLALTVFCLALAAGCAKTENPTANDTSKNTGPSVITGGKDGKKKMSGPPPD